MLYKCYVKNIIFIIFFNANFYTVKNKKILRLNYINFEVRGLAWTEYKNIVEMVIYTRNHHARLTTTGQTEKERECHFFSVKNNYCTEIQFCRFCLYGNTSFDKTKYIKMLLHWGPVLSL